MQKRSGSRAFADDLREKAIAAPLAVYMPPPWPCQALRPFCHFLNRRSPRATLAHAVDQRDLIAVLQILPHALERMDNRNPPLLELFPRANSGKHQELRRIESAAR